jgi:hypothetical protein
MRHSRTPAETPQAGPSGFYARRSLMRRELSILSAVILLTAGTAAGAAAQGMMMGGMHGDRAYGCDMMCGGMMGGGMMGGMLCGMADGDDWSMIDEKLGLTAEQKDKMMTNNRETVRKMMELRNQLSMSMFDLNTEMRMMNPDMKKVDKLVGDIASTQKMMLQNRIDAIGKMRGIMTKDQWEMFGHMKMKSRMMNDDDDRGQTMRRGMQGMH